MQSTLNSIPRTLDEERERGKGAWACLGPPHTQTLWLALLLCREIDPSQARLRPLLPPPLVKKLLQQRQTLSLYVCVPLSLNRERGGVSSVIRRRVP